MFRDAIQAVTEVELDEKLAGSGAIGWRNLAMYPPIAMGTQGRPVRPSLDRWRADSPGPERQL